MRFEKNKKIFLRVCEKCHKQFQDEDLYNKHIKFCGSMSFNMPKNISVSEKEIKKVDVKQDLSDKKVIEENSIAVDDFSDIDTITKVDNKSLEDNKELDEVVLEDTEETLEDTEIDEELIEEKETDLTEILPVEEEKEPFKRGRSMKKGYKKKSTKKKATKKKD